MSASMDHETSSFGENGVSSPIDAQKYKPKKQLSRYNPDSSHKKKRSTTNYTGGGGGGGEDDSGALRSSQNHYLEDMNYLCSESDWVGLQALLGHLEDDTLNKSLDKESTTPLHLACANAAPFSVVQTITEMCPGAVTKPDIHGSLPLHYVVSSIRPDDEDSDDIVEILLLLLQKFPDSISYKNYDGQTPLHNFFSNPIIFSASFSSDAIIEVLKLLLDIIPNEEVSVHSNQSSQEIEMAMEVYEALRTPNNQNELPLHVACQNMSTQTSPAISLIAKCCPEAIKTLTDKGDLPIHLYYRTWCVRKEKIDESHMKAIRALLIPLLQDLESVKCSGSNGFILPIHIACAFGCDYNLLNELSLAYPEGVTFPMRETDHSTKAPYAIELFEKSPIATEAKVIHNDLVNNKTSHLSEAAQLELIQKFNYFIQFSDLLFAYFPEAIPTDIKQKLFRHDKARITRLERQIKNEALSKRSELSLTSSLVWKWMCEFEYVEGSNDNYNASIGRIISGLDPTSLWKLTFFKPGGTTNEDPLQKQGNIINLRNGRTIVAEAEERTPNTTFDDMMGYKWFFNELLSHLSGIDAVRASKTCKLTLKHGVKSLVEIEGVVKKGAFEIPIVGNGEFVRSPPQPWQRVELVVGECTHSFQVSYVIEEGLEGGMLVVRNDGENIKPNNKHPWGDAVLAYPRSQNIVDDEGQKKNFVTLQVPHKEGRTYGLWYYFPTRPKKHEISLIISQVKIRQFVYCLDRNARSPLHCLLQRLHPVTRLSDRINILLKSNFGPTFYSMFTSETKEPTTSYSNLIVLGVKAGVDETTLSLLVSSSPSSLLDTDKDRRTPLHSTFLISKSIPSVSIIQTLLVTPGENALKVKDATGRLPIHIAAERNASAEVLALLIRLYPDGSYRTNKDGDLPVHLLIRNEAVNQASVELLLRQIMKNYSICRTMGGARMLPLHIACDYCVAPDILQNLLKTYPHGAQIPRGSDGYYPIEILELHRKALWKVVKEEKSSNGAGQGKEDESFSESISTPKSMNESIKPPPKLPNINYESMDDLNTKSDWVFVYYPGLPLDKLNMSSIPYRLDSNRISRLSKMIKRELLLQQQQQLQVAQSKKIQMTFNLSFLAQLSWVFLTTTPYSSSQDDYFEEFEDDSLLRYQQGKSSDAYANVTSGILQGLHVDAVRFLSRLQDSQQREIQDVATPVCRKLILSKLRFLHKYKLVNVLHRGHDCLLIRALDYSLEVEYEKLKKYCNKSIQDDKTGSTSAPSGLPWGLFCKFAEKLGVDEKLADKYFTRLEQMQAQQNEMEDIIPDEISEEASLTTLQTLESIIEENEEAEDEDTMFDQGDDIFHNTDELYSSAGVSASGQSKRVVNLVMFEEFCKGFGMNENGSRRVIFKFFIHYHHFVRESKARNLMVGAKFIDWVIVPILEDFDIDRKVKKSKDDLFQKEIIDKSESSIFDLSKFRYAIVLPEAASDLRQIFIHEKPTITQTRQYMLHIGKALSKLHQRRMIHGNVSMSNIVRFNNRLSLIDLDAMYKIPKAESTRVFEPMGGASHSWSSGLLPPEMIVQINPETQSVELENYELYWKNVSEDAKDLKILTPDDINIISSVVKSQLAQAEAKRNTNEATPTKTNSASQNSSENPNRHLSKASSRRVPSSHWIGMHDVGLSGEEEEEEEEDSSEWKQMLSLALITISFDDLPFSLTSCKTIREFAVIWKRLLCNAALWEKIKPRFNPNDDFIYVVRGWQEKPKNSNPEKTSARSGDPSLLPYEPLQVSEKIDIWGFGVLTFAMCSGCSLFSVDRYENLVDGEIFSQLYNWDQKVAKKIIREKVEDPLAQDLLLLILKPESERPADMERVLKHPFFGLNSGGLEAQRILEKHEELQLMLEETTVLNTFTTETKKILQLSCEKQCKIVFEEEVIVVPTCLIILPYKLYDNGVDESPVVPLDSQYVDLAVQIGKYLLEINKSTAKLSFWLMMKKKMTGKDGREFKAKLKDWLRRARVEPCDEIAKEIVSVVGCGNEYLELCREVLEKEESVSQAKAYIRDPMSTARHAVRDSTESLVKYFSSQIQYLYLVDEFSSMPKLPEIDKNTLIMEENSDSEIVYPIKIDPQTRHFQLLFLPFVNVTVMKQTALSGLEGLARLLGIPKAHGIPDTWISEKPGLIHRLEKPSTLAEFAVLQDVVMTQDRQAASSYNLLGHNHVDSISVRTGMSVWSETTIDENNRITELELFFREYDPMRDFTGLRRVTDGRNCAIWTSREYIQGVQNQTELASIETKLRELYKELNKKEEIKHEIIKLKRELKTLKKNDVSMRFSHNNAPQTPTPERHFESNNYENGLSNTAPGMDNVALSNGHGKEMMSQPPFPEEQSPEPPKRKVRPFFGKCLNK